MKRKPVTPGIPGRIVSPAWTPEELVEIVRTRVWQRLLTPKQGEREIERIRAAAPACKARPVKITPAQLQAVQDRTRENLNKSQRKPQRSKGRSR